MKSINLNHIIAIAGLKPTHLAKEIFPDRKHPYNALNYVTSGKGFLDSQQIAKLAEILNVPIGLLFEDAAWHISLPAPADKEARIMQFKAYDYLAQLDLDTMVTTVRQPANTIIETITHDGGMAINEYLSFLTDLIIKYKQKP